MPRSSDYEFLMETHETLVAVQKEKRGEVSYAAITAELLVGRFTRRTPRMPQSQRQDTVHQDSRLQTWARWRWRWCWRSLLPDPNFVVPTTTRLLLEHTYSLHEW